MKYNEPILLVGETGTGKTTLVQNLAARLGKTLTVLVYLQIFGIVLHMHSHLYCIKMSNIMSINVFFIFQNLSQQSDIADLLGGFKPTSARSICIQIHQELVEMFCKDFTKSHKVWKHMFLC